MVVVEMGKWTTEEENVEERRDATTKRQNISKGRNVHGRGREPVWERKEILREPCLT